MKTKNRKTKGDKINNVLKRYFVLTAKYYGKREIVILK